MDRTWVEDAKEAGERFPFVLQAKVYYLMCIPKDQQFRVVVQWGEYKISTSFEKEKN